MNDRPGRREFEPVKILRSAEIWIFLFYAAVTAVMTYPAVTLLSRTYAERRDPLGTLWWLWWYKYSYAHHMATSPMKMIAVPWGIRNSPYGTDPLYGIITHTLSIITNETVTYNLFLLASFFLAAVGMYFLVRHLTASRAAAAFAGLAFAFSPYMLAQGKEHLGLAATFWLPLFALSLVIAWRSRTGWSIAVCGAVLIVLTLFNYQYGMLAAVFAATFLVTVWLAGAPWRRSRFDWGMFLKVTAVLIVIAAVAALSLVALARSTSGGDKPIEALYQFSARPWDYVLPSPESAVAGGLTSGFINSHLHGSFLVEDSLFLGYTTLVLAVFAMLVAFRRRGARSAAMRSHRGDGDEAGPVEPGAREAPRLSDQPYTGKTVLAFAVCAAVAFVFSMPPTARVLGVKIYFPSYLLFKVLPQFRAYARFGIIVMMCAVALAGYGIAFIAERMKNKNAVPIVAAVLMGLIVLEFSIVPPFRSLDTAATTDYYRWLGKQPGRQAVAVYPFFVLDDFYNYGYLFAQRMHLKDLLNGAQPDTPAERYRECVLDIKHPATPGLLKRAGARYVIVIPEYYTEGVVHPNYVYPTALDDRPMPPGLRKVKSFRDATVYEVTAAPASFVARFDIGSFEPYVDPGGRSWHPGSNETLVGIRSYLKQPATCTIRLKVMSARSTSTMRFSANGETKSVVVVPSWPVDVELKDVFLSPGVNTLKIESDGRPANLTEVPGYSQIRATMMVSDLEVKVAP